MLLQQIQVSSLLSYLPPGWITARLVAVHEASLMPFYYLLHLGVSTHDGQVHFFDVTQKNKQRVRLESAIRSYNAHKSRVNSLIYSTSMMHFVTMADDGRVKLWNLGEAGSEKPLWKCHGHTDQVRDGRVGERSDNLLVTGEQTGTNLRGFRLKSVH